MKEVHHKFFVGSQQDLPLAQSQGWMIVHAAKEPWHREAVGYSPGKAAPRGDEYYFAYRGKELALNLIDAADPKYIPDSVMDEGVKFIHTSISQNKVVFVHCNMGRSRSPGLAFYYLWKYKILPQNFIEAWKKFCILYPLFAPAGGIQGFLESRCKITPQEKDERPVRPERPLSDLEFNQRFG